VLTAPPRADALSEKRIRLKEENRNMPAKTAKKKPAARKPAPRKPAARKPAASKSNGKSGSKVVPLGDRIVVKQTRQDEVRASGLVIPDTAREKPQLGVVIAVGPGRVDDNGKRVPVDVKSGDRVLYAKYSGQDVPRGVFGDEDDYMILKESDILAKLA
jgi:chaperonin GroES